MTAAGRRRAVEHLRGCRVSARRACRLTGFSRSALWRPRQGRDDRALRSRLRSLAASYPRYGCPTLHAMLKREGLVINAKRTRRLYREEGLQVRGRRRRKLVRPRLPMPVPARLNQRWSMDFVSDQLADGRRFRVLNVVDDYSRECVLQVVDRSITGGRVARELHRLDRSLPQTLVCDNGPEFTGKAMFFWAKDAGVKLHFIQPGKPTQNAFVESFNGKFREYCLNLHWFSSLGDARAIIDDWREHYNEVRPHRSLGNAPPKAFARQAA